jgi:hypothetical protein
MDRIIERRIRLQAESLNSFYKRHFIPEKPSGENLRKVYKEYKALLGLGVVQGFSMQPFNVDHWWKLQNSFDDQILEKTKPLIFLEIKAKQFVKDKQPQKAAVCIKEFKKLSPIISLLVFEYLFGKRTFYAYHEQGIVYRRDIIIP